MTEHEKKLIQARHRLEEAQMRDRDKERKARTRRLIQTGGYPRKGLSPGTNHDHRRTGGVPVQYAENQVTRQPTKEAFRATGMLPLLFIPEGRTDSPPEGRWSPLAGPCALRGGISCLRTRPKGFPLVLWKPSVALLTERDRLLCHIPICHPTLRLAVLPLAAHLRHDATCHWQLAGTTGMGNDEGGERRWPSITCRQKS